ncbi:pyridoxamine 5'-phosphate oxidase family protein, partial [Mycobacterium tuberculosis]|nr:pyridoxamine 5'-phosphate oxidase family protein [Mycobacterium tuberculosis]
VMAEVVSPTIAYAAVSGPGIGYVDGTKDDLVEMATRYLPAEKVAGYVEFATSDHGAQTKVVVRPKQWVASDLGSV